MFKIEFATSVEKDLSGFRAFERNRILKAIEEQLSRDPCVETRNRKALVNLILPFEAVPPVWELRIGETSSPAMTFRPAASSGSVFRGTPFLRGIRAFSLATGPGFLVLAFG